MEGLFQGVLGLILPALLLVSTASAQSRMGNLGDLQGPIESLGSITSLTEEIQKNLSSPMKDLVDENDCDRTITLPDENPPLKAGDAQVPVFSIDITGKGCPITYHVSFDGKQLQDGFDGVFIFQFVAQSAEAKALNDVDEASFQGKLSARSLQIPQGGGVELNFQYDGKGHSQKEGPFTQLSSLAGKMLVSMGTAGPMNIKIEGGFKETMGFSFKKANADFVSETTFQGLSPQATFSINGKSVTEEEYRKIRDRIKLPGMDLKNGGLGGDTDEPSLACTAEVYRSSEFSPSNAQTWVNGGRRGAKPIPVKVSTACGSGTNMDLGQVDGGQYQARFTSNPSFTSVFVEICDASRACRSSERSFLPDESATYVDQLLGTFTVLTSCEVVKSCAP